MEPGVRAGEKDVRDRFPSGARDGLTREAFESGGDGFVLSHAALTARPLSSRMRDETAEYIRAPVVFRERTRFC